MTDVWDSLPGPSEARLDGPRLRAAPGGKTAARGQP
jgi:hypothetical protein